MNEETPRQSPDSLPSSDDVQLLNRFHERLADAESLASLALSDEETERILYEAAQREVYADTEARAILYDTRKITEERRPSPRGATSQIQITKGAVNIELVEAYAVIAPEEALSLINSMPDGEYTRGKEKITYENAKIEALAKYGFITGDDQSIAQARDIAKKKLKVIGPREGVDYEYPEGANWIEELAIREPHNIKHKLQMDEAMNRKLLLVATYGRDVESMRLLFKRGEKGEYPEVSEGVSNLAALGYLPAIESEKQRALYWSQDYHQKTFDDEQLQKLDQLIAGIVAIEDHIQTGKLDPLSSEKDEMLDALKAEELNTQWWDLIRRRQEGVIRELQAREQIMPQLPAMFEQGLGEVNIEEMLEKAEQAVEKDGLNIFKDAYDAIYSEGDPDDPEKYAWVKAVARAIKHSALRKHQAEQTSNL